MLDYDAVAKAARDWIRREIADGEDPPTMEDACRLVIENYLENLTGELGLELGRTAADIAVYASERERRLRDDPDDRHGQAWLERQLGEDANRLLGKGTWSSERHGAYSDIRASGLHGTLELRLRFEGPPAPRDAHCGWCPDGMLSSATETPDGARYCTNPDCASNEE